MRRLHMHINELLRKGLPPAEIVKRVGCSESYIRSVRSGHRGTEEAKARERIAHRADTKYEPLPSPHLNRLAQMHKAGLSIWELQQMMPHAGVEKAP